MDNDAEDVTDLDQHTLAICTECLVKLLCVLNGLEKTLRASALEQTCQGS